MYTNGAERLNIQTIVTCKRTQRSLVTFHDTVKEPHPTISDRLTGEKGTPMNNKQFDRSNSFTFFKNFRDTLDKYGAHTALEAAAPGRSRTHRRKLSGRCSVKENPSGTLQHSCRYPPAHCPTSCIMIMLMKNMMIKKNMKLKVMIYLKILMKPTMI